MVEPPAGKSKAGRNVFRFEIRQLFQNLLLGESRGKQIENINHPNPHSANAGPPPALLRIHRNALDESGHVRTFLDQYTEYRLGDSVPNQTTQDHG